MNRPTWRLLTLLSLAVLSLGLLAACEDDEDGDATNGETPAGNGTVTATPADGGEASTVAVELNEWNVVPDPDSVSTGEVTFEAENTGSIPHNLLIIQSDEAPDSLPVESNQVPESEVDIVGRIEQFPAGETQSTTVDLESGSYILICNIPAHYEQGMFAGFTVE